MQKCFFVASVLLALAAPASAAQAEQQHAPDVASVYMTFKKPFTLKACTDRVADVIRKHTGAEFVIDPMPSGAGITGGGINIVIRCAPDLKAILFVAAGPKKLLGETLTFYFTIFELEVKLGERK
jgi:hypothetical protein